ncbi:serine hydrolase [bacterium]|nr:serine hydrolase [bacterium]
MTGPICLALSAASQAEPQSPPNGGYGAQKSAVRGYTQTSRLKAVKQQTDAIVSRHPNMRIGYSIVHVPTGHSVSHLGDELFPLASVFKIPVMLEFCRQMQDGVIPLNLDHQLTVRKSDICIGSGKLKNAAPNSKITVDKAINLMITVSDNTATDMIINTIGGKSLRSCMESWGLTDNKIFMTNRQAWLISLGKGSLLPDANPEHIASAWKKLSYADQIALAEEVYRDYADISVTQFQKMEDESGLGYTFTQWRKCAETVDNMSSPNDFSQLLRKLWNREILEEEWSEYALSVLAAQKYNTRIPKYLPPGTKTYHKTGTICGVVNDSGIIISRRGEPVAVTVFVSDVGASDADSDTAEQIIGKISKIAWENF